MPDKKIEKQTEKTYVKAIENSVDSRLFNSLYVKDLKVNRVYDVLNDGELSCAYYVSGLLTIFGLIDCPHATVESVTKKLLENDWIEVPFTQAKAGDVLIWEKVVFPDGSESDHNGFYLDSERAVSTSLQKRCVIAHHPTYKGTRNITKVLHYNKF